MLQLHYMANRKKNSAATIWKKTHNKETEILNHHLHIN